MILNSINISGNNRQILDNLSTLGPAEFAQCKDDFNIFTLDLNQTKTNPEKVIPGGQFDIDLFGKLTQPVEVLNIHLGAKFENKDYIDKNYKKTIKYDQKYEQSL